MKKWLIIAGVIVIVAVLIQREQRPPEGVAQQGDAQEITDPARMTSAKPDPIASTIPVAQKRSGSSDRLLLQYDREQRFADGSYAATWDFEQIRSLDTGDILQLSLPGQEEPYQVKVNEVLSTGNRYRLTGRILSEDAFQSLNFTVTQTEDGSYVSAYADTPIGGFHLKVGPDGGRLRETAYENQTLLEHEPELHVDDVAH